MNYIKLTLPIFLLVLLCSTGLKAQRSVDTQQLLWMRYSLKLKLNDNYEIRQELEERTYWFPWRQHQFLSRTFANRALGKNWTAGIGFTSLLVSLPNNAKTATISDQLELRPQLEITYKQTISEKISLFHRYWSDFRFFERPDGSFEYSNNRTRYLLEFRYSPIRQLTLKAFDEIHINIGKNIAPNVFDQNRYGASVQYMPFKNFGFELGYLNLFQQQKSGVDFYDRNVVRLTIHHIIQFRNPKT